MRSGWFWGTPEWAAYLTEYAKTRPEELRMWKSSPLSDDHDFSDLRETDMVTEHYSQVIDLRTQSWSDVRKSYRSLINQANRAYTIRPQDGIWTYYHVHLAAFGLARTWETFEHQGQWLRDDLAACWVAHDSSDTPIGAVLWICYQGKAYYASAPSLEPDVMHALVWHSCVELRKQGMTHAEMGQIDGDEAMTRGIFKRGFGGDAKPFQLVVRQA